MPTIILYAVEIAEMERWVGSRDVRLLEEAKEILREDPDAGWEKSELEVLDRLLERMVRDGQLYDGLGPEESYYLTQALIDLFDELVESEAVPEEEIPLEALDQALQRLGDPAGEVRSWLIQGRLLGSDRTVWDRASRIDDVSPYFGYVRHRELAPLAAAIEAATRSQPPRGARGRGAGALSQLATACRAALESERDLMSFVS